MAHKKADINGFNYEQFADSLFGLYQQNSFGSVSKRELDLFLFANFKKMGRIQGCFSWDIAQELKISKSKAQSLLYESELRYRSQDDKELIQCALDKIPQFIDKGVVSLVVDNRYVRDCMRSFLSKKGFISDLSFASDVVKMPIDAYWELQSEYNKESVKSLRKEDFVNNLKSLGKDVFPGLVSRFVGEPVGQSVSKILSSFFKFVLEEKNNVSN